MGRVKGFGFYVLDSWFGVQGVRFRVRGLRLVVGVSAFRGFGIRVYSLGFRV